MTAAARQELQRANLLFTPRIGPPGYEGVPNFVSGTNEILNYCKEYQREGLEAYLCLGNLEYLEVEFNSYDIFLPDVIVERIIIPIYVKVMNGFIAEKLQSHLPTTYV